MVTGGIPYLEVGMVLATFDARAIHAGITHCTD